jgi:S-DNA-T family DNA segregation ATPase FtsK/SpoIIIE
MEILIKKLIKQLEHINSRLSRIEKKVDNSHFDEPQYEDSYDELLDEAIRLVVESGTASASFLQRRMQIGYARAARLLDLMEEKGIVGPSKGATPRDVLVDKYLEN